MRRLLSLIFVLLSVTSSVSAWALTWTNADGNSYVVHQHDPVDCQKIKQAEGEDFRWSPEEDGLSIWLFENDKCSGSRAGYSPPTFWSRVSSRDLLSFRVALEDRNGNPTTTTKSTSTSTSTETSTTSTTTTPSSTESTPTPTSSTTNTPTGDDAASDDSSVPAGAVAGGVVAGVAGAAAVGGLFFFLGRRRRSSRVQPAPQESGPDANPTTGADPGNSPPPTPMDYAARGPEPYDPSWYNGKLELDSAPIYQVASPIYPDDMAKQPASPLDTSTMPHQPPVRMLAELPGDAFMAEMSDSHRLNELEGDGRTKR